MRRLGLALCGVLAGVSLAISISLLVHLATPRQPEISGGDEPFCIHLEQRREVMCPPTPTPGTSSP